MTTTTAPPTAADAVTAAEVGPGAEPLPQKGLFDRDWQKALVIFLTLLAGLALLWVVWLIVRPILHILVLFGLGGVLAFAVTKPVDLLRPRLHSRVLAIVLVYGVLAVVLIGGLVLLAGPFVKEVGAIVGDLPTYETQLEQEVPQVQDFLGNLGVQVDVNQVKASATNLPAQGGPDVVKNIISTATGLLGVILDIVLTLVISLYLLVDGPKIRRRTLAIVPPNFRNQALFFEDNASRVLGGYLRGQLTLAVIIGLMAGVGTGLMGLPYALVLGVLAGFFELIPMFGPILSAIPALSVALFLPFPKVLWVALYFLAIQQIENNVLAPRISGHAVGLHPLGALFALLVGFEVGGVLGGLFAVPIAGVLWVLIAAGYRNALAEETPKPRGWSFPPFRRRLIATPRGARTNPDTERPGNG